MILLKSLKVKIQGSKISKTRARESGASVFSSFLFPKAAAPAKRAIQRASKKEGGWGGRNFCPPVSEAKPRRSARKLAGRNRAEKFSLPFKRKKWSRAKSKNEEKIFLRGCRRSVSGGGRRGEFIGRGSRQKKFGFRPKGTAFASLKSRFHRDESGLRLDIA